MDVKCEKEKRKKNEMKWHGKISDAKCIRFRSLFENNKEKHHFDADYLKVKNNKLPKFKFVQLNRERFPLEHNFIPMMKWTFKNDAN